MLSKQKVSTLRAFVDTPRGQIHYVTAGRGKPVVLLHQTPRSSDEYRDVIPLLARRLRVIAMDTIGYGDSYKPKKNCSIEDYARGAVDLLDGLKISKVCLVGHHTGAVIAMELAASHPGRVERLVLSHCSYFDRAKRESLKDRPPIDEVEFKEDGSHLVEMWNRRSSFYPKGRPDLLLRYFVDALKAGNKIEEGHHACEAYHMEEKIGLIKCPTLLICGTDDPYAFPDQEKLKSKIKGSVYKTIPGGMVPLPDQMPMEFAHVITPFLSAH